MLRTEPKAVGADLEAFLAHYKSLVAEGSVVAALLAGFVADRLAHAFAAGYQSALHALVPSLPADAVAALLATEEQGAYPRAIATVFRDGRLFGKKKWATLATLADRFLVVAKIGEDAGRPKLAVVSVAADAPGVSLAPLPPTAFVPELPHAEVGLDGVVGEVLAGDGYDAYLKPFRTREDVFVHLAVLAYVLAEARRHGWPDAFKERIAAALLTFAALAESSINAPTTHVALAGAIAEAGRLFADSAPLWSGEAGERWQRDGALMNVANTARERRRARAWERLRAPPS
jgi:hypothetical protein